MHRTDPYAIPEAGDVEDGIICLCSHWLALQRLEVPLPAATQLSPPSHLHEKIKLEVVESHSVVDLTIRMDRLVDEFVGEACLQAGVGVF